MGIYPGWANLVVSGTVVVVGMPQRAEMGSGLRSSKQSCLCLAGLAAGKVSVSDKVSIKYQPLRVDLILLSRLDDRVADCAQVTKAACHDEDRKPHAETSNKNCPRG